MYLKSCFFVANHCNIILPVLAVLFYASWGYLAWHKIIVPLFFEEA